MRMTALMLPLLLIATNARAQPLKAESIDSIPTATLLSLRIDTQGPLFVGGRESLLVYEPNEKGNMTRRTRITGTIIETSANPDAAT